MVWEEVSLVRSRQERLLAIEASLFQMALSTIPNQSIKATGTKKAVKDFESVLRSMSEG